MKNACRIIIDDIINGKISTRRDLEVRKRQLCRELKLSRFMSNADILEYATAEEKELVSDTLKKKPTRTQSGVAIVAVMCHPHKCPHGRCLYCPESDIAPPSYTGEEPAALRARMYNFDPYNQVYNRSMLFLYLSNMAYIYPYKPQIPCYDYVFSNVLIREE